MNPIEKFELKEWDRLIAINLTAPFITMKTAISYWKSLKNPYGRIINISSVHGLVASVNKSAYVASKHGLNGLTKVAALELANTNITVNAICLGWVDTKLVRKQIQVILLFKN